MCPRGPRAAPPFHVPSRVLRSLRVALASWYCERAAGALLGSRQARRRPLPQRARYHSPGLAVPPGVVLGQEAWPWGAQISSEQQTLPWLVLHWLREMSGRGLWHVGQSVQMEAAGSPATFLLTTALLPPVSCWPEMRFLHVGAGLRVQSCSRTRKGGLGWRWGPQHAPKRGVT